MVIAKIKYGLGNQIFQYAFGLRVALARGEELKLDTFWYDDNNIDPEVKVRNFGLRNFNISEQSCTRREQERFRIYRKGLLQKTRIGMRKLIRSHPDPGYFADSNMKGGKAKKIEEIISYDGDVYLDGVWGRKSYFCGIEGFLRKRLKPTFYLTGENKNALEEIKSCTSIAVHIRRGDFIKEKKFRNEFSKFTPNKYYSNSVDYIVDKLNKPENVKIFAFSDDIEWVKKNINLGHYTKYLHHNGEEDGYKDFYLMSQCSHNVISNSSFSWWASWLNANPKKLVVGPEPWSGTAPNPDLVEEIIQL